MCTPGITYGYVVFKRVFRVVCRTARPAGTCGRNQHASRRQDGWSGKLHVRKTKSFRFDIFHVWRAAGLRLPHAPPPRRDATTSDFLSKRRYIFYILCKRDNKFIRQKGCGVASYIYHCRRTRRSVGSRYDVWAVVHSSCILYALLRQYDLYAWSTCVYYVQNAFYRVINVLLRVPTACE